MNNIFDDFNKNITNTAKMFSDIQDSLDEQRKHEFELQNAILDTSKNTQAISKDMKNVIHNQNKEIELMEHQLNIVKDIFNNSDRSLEIEKELLEILKKDKNYPLTKILEKTSDFSLNVLANYTTPFIMNTLRTILIKNGILL